MNMTDLQDIDEFKMIQDSITTMKAYIQREIDSNDGLLQRSRAISYATFLKVMQKEISFMVSQIYLAANTTSQEIPIDLNCTLDDVAIPTSFLDEDLKIDFESSSKQVDLNDYRDQESLSSFYYSANESFDSTQEDVEDQEVVQGNDAINIVQALPVVSCEELVDPITSEASQATCEPNIFICEIPADHFRKHRFNPNDTESYKISDISNVNSSDIISQKHGNEDKFATPPLSPPRAENTMDSISEALEAMKINRRCFDVNVEDEILTGSNEVEKQSKKQIASSQSLLRQPTPSFMKKTKYRRISDQQERQPLKSLQLENNRNSLC